MGNKFFLNSYFVMQSTFCINNLKSIKMSKNQLLASSILIFIMLFYEQSLGVNLAIFSFIVWASMLLLTPKATKDKMFWMLSAGVFISGFSFAWYGDFISFCALFILCLVSCYYAMFGKSLHILLCPLLWVYNYASAIVRVFFFSQWIKSPHFKTASIKQLFAFIIIPLSFLLLFSLIYISSSPMLMNYFRNFNLRLTLYGWQLLFLFLLGFFLMFNIYHFHVHTQLKAYNETLHDNFTYSQTTTTKPRFSLLSIDMERKSGEITLFLLNMLLVFFLIMYNIEQFCSFSHESFSNNIHERVNTLIFSIVMAIALIMFYFKSALPFHKQASMLDYLAYAWIFLNTLLVFSAIISNSEYVHQMGLTFKRVGVYIFLLLSLTGLVFTYLKIKNKKTNTYLMKNMFWSFIIALVLGSAINWSWIVTKYNLTCHSKPDMLYLTTLNFNKQILYKELRNREISQHEITEIETSIENDVNRERSNPFLSKTLYYEFVKLN